MLVERLAADTGLTIPYLEMLARSAAHRYKLYAIPKRNGTARLIAHPSRPLKFLQRWLATNLFSHLPINAAATAYRKGMGIRDNASMHASNNYLLKLDVLDFFPSIRSEDIALLLQNALPAEIMELSPHDRWFVTSTVTRNGSLPVGAPSSPIISNAVMYRFDCLTAADCAEHGVAFTRYADDMFFSTNHPNVLDAIHKNVIRRLQDLQSPRFALNTVKTVHTSRRHRRIVTGLVLTSEHRISLGRKNKKRVRSLLQRLRDAQIGVEDRQYLAGYLAYSQAIEPSFLTSLCKKYGKLLIEQAAQNAAHPVAEPGGVADEI